MKSDIEILRDKIEASVLTQDRLVFLYTKDDGSQVTRYATPTRVFQTLDPTDASKTDYCVDCVQHSPKDGFRKFKLSRMSQVSRVIARA